LKKERHNYTPQEKVTILRKHLIEKQPVSEICDKHNLQPTVFQRWMKEFFENGAAALDREPNEKLEEKLRKKDEVMAELLEEYVIVKKVLGRSEPAMGRARHSGPNRRLRPGMERKDLDRRVSVDPMAEDRRQPVLRLEESLWESQRAQCPDTARPLAGGMGEKGHHRFSSRKSLGRISPPDVHDAGPQRGCRQSLQRLESAGQAGLLQRWNRKASLKGTGFQQPLKPHEHWHVDVSYINTSGTFYYLCSVLDVASRYIVHWEIRESMKEQEVEIILQRAAEKFPEAKPRLISDNGPQFIAKDFKDFKEFIRICGMTHVRTSPFYPQSNGKIERWHKSIKTECIRPGVPLSMEDAERIVGRWVGHYNTVRLHSAIGYIAPSDKLEGRETQIFAERDRKRFLLAGHNFKPNVRKPDIPRHSLGAKKERPTRLFIFPTAPTCMVSGWRTYDGVGTTQAMEFSCAK
jgi:transposase InsO family protein/transposase-like protein